MSPLVSVVIASLDDLSKLKRSVQSVLDQSTGDLELIVIDGASTDGTVEYLGSLTDPRVVWKSESDGSITEAWNKAISLARGDWIIFLGADDYLWDSDVIARAAPFLKSSTAAFGMGEVFVVGPNDDVVVQKVRFDVPRLLKQLRGPNGLGLPHQGFFHNRSVFKDGGFNISFRLAADYELITRYTRPSDFVFLPIGPVAAFRFGGLTTRPFISLELSREFIQARKLHGQRWLSFSWPLLKAYVKIFMKKALTARLAQRIVNFSRMVRSIPPYQN